MRKLFFGPVLPLLLAFAFVAPSSVRGADARIRSAQEKLADLGFYTGKPDGEANPETQGAIRRFQIYKGLTVSGNLDAETEAALADAEAAGATETETSQAAAPVQSATPVPPSTQQSDREFLQREAEAAPQVAPERRLSGKATKFLGDWFRDTPYETAPPEVQTATLGKAHALLRQRGLLEGDEVGNLPGPETEEAIFRYQSARGLRLTGRLDFDTLASMRLLPSGERPTKEAPKTKAATPPPDSVEGAVRGIPLD